MTQRLLNASLLSLASILLMSCASTPKERLVTKIVKLCPEESFYIEPVPDGLTDDMTLAEIPVSLSLALGQANADRKQIKSYCD